MATLRSQVGALVRHHRERLGMTQAQLAEKSARSVELIGRIERGATAPSFETLETFSRVLATPARDFFGSGSFDAASGREDPLAQLVTRVSTLDSGDLDWINRLVSVALSRKVRTPPA